MMAERVTLGDVNQLCNSHEFGLSSFAEQSDLYTQSSIIKKKAPSSRNKQDDLYMQNL
jgi:hypothetical protein